MALLPTLEELKRVDTSHDLILSLTPTQEIIQFNKESERFTGFLRDEVIHKKLSEILIPQESTSQWIDLFVSIQQDMWIDNFVLPLKTKDNQVHMVTWTGFLVKDEQGIVKDICIFGKPLKTESIKQQEKVVVQQFPQQKTLVSEIQKSEIISEIQRTITRPASPVEKVKVDLFRKQEELVPELKKDSVLPETQKTEVSPEIPFINERSLPQQKEVVPEVKKPEVVPKKLQSPIAAPMTTVEPQQLCKEVPMKHGMKKILFAHENETTKEQTHQVIPEKPPRLMERDTSPASSKSLEKYYDVTSQKLDTVLQSLSELSQKYETVLKRVSELETKKESLIKNQKHEETILPPKKEEPVQIKKDYSPSRVDSKTEDEQQLEEKEHTFFSDPFGFKRQHAELDLKKQRVELRVKQLELFETRLMKEKDLMHARVEEFSKWQEKLIALESEIEKRRQELMKQENFDLGARSPPVDSRPTSPTNLNQQKNIDREGPACDDETLEKIPQSAAIIQRGILKQINTSFLTLLGYPPEEIVEKSYFDFIALEGLADVEKYYMDRLKGDAVSVYRTVFSAKDNKKIPVEVTIKQTIYNGEKAEIAVVTCLTQSSV